MNGGPSGFTNAPVTRAFIITSALFTIFFGIQGRFSTLGLSYQDIFGKLRLWKLIISIFSFSSTPELMFGLYLLYYFRVFERQIGSNKYSVFIVFSILTSLLLEVLAVALLKVTAYTIGRHPLPSATFRRHQPPFAVVRRCETDQRTHQHKCLLQISPSLKFHRQPPPDAPPLAVFVSDTCKPRATVQAIFFDSAAT
ncbi:Rhomboid-like protein 20 [Glycine soja]|uniref:Rhomboid-like protein 20 n=1 Tax=Glycine soja TaxID=3848 RepID=A0A445FFY4_GLYSO|nr:Rhomboid-like protein 20 [Glycine soja]